MTNRSQYRPTQVTVDLAQIRANYRTLRSLVSKNAFFCPMVKANAYGHGDIEIGRALREEGASHLGVALIEEGIRLRNAGDKGEILFFGVSGLDDAEAILSFQLTPVICTWDQLRSFEKVLVDRKSKQLKVHLEFNTGMNRLGFAPGYARELMDWLRQRPHFQLEGICTHLLKGDDASSANGESAQQIAKFIEALKPFAGSGARAHVLNSAAAAQTLATRPEWRDELARLGFADFGARPGISLYGMQPTDSAKLDLKPALSWVSKIISVQSVKPGEAVSYNAAWRAKRDSIIGVIPAGYADGVWRHLSNRGSVLCRNRKVPIVGTVCMDYFMVDLTDVVSPHSPSEHLSVGAVVGEPVVLIGRQGEERITVEDIAREVGTISYEVFTRISERVPRVYSRQ